MRRLNGSLAVRAIGLGAMAVLEAYWFLQPVPAELKAITAVVLAVSLIKPAWGLMVFAGLAPLSTPVAHLFGGAALGGQMLGHLALSVGAGSVLRGGPTAGRSRLGSPALLVVTVALASAAAMLLAEALPTFPGLSGPGVRISDLWVRQIAESSPTWAPGFAALTIAECALLGWAAERTIRTSPFLLPRLVALGLIGHAGAAVLDIYTVLGTAVASGHALEQLPRLLSSVRVSMQTDVHAAASALLLAGVAGFGLLTGSVTKRVIVTCLLLVVGTGVWITGSRTAIVLAVVTTSAAIGWAAAIRAPRSRVLVVGATVLTLIAGAWLATQYPQRRYNSVAGSVQARVVLLEAGIQMFKANPVFGVGVGRFYASSAAYIAPDEVNVVGYTQENAHNNFVQVLAEEGLIGLGAMLWWLGVVLLRARGSQATGANPMRSALLLAIVACAGTWLTGHPLLVPEFSLVFWFYCGLLVSTTDPPPAHRRRWPLWLLLAAVLISVPFRAEALRNAVVLEHRGVGLSLWQHDDAQRYRDAGQTFGIFLPTGRDVDVPMRRAPGLTGPLVVEARLNGRLLASSSVEGDEWRVVVVGVPGSARTFELVDFSVRTPTPSGTAAGTLVRVGRAVPR